MLIQADKLSTDALRDYDQMMVESIAKVDLFSMIAAKVWSDVLKALQARGDITLLSGSLDDVGNMLVRRNWLT